MPYHLFNSPQKIKLLQLFLNHTKGPLSVQETARKLRLTRPATARMLHQFANIGVLKVAKKGEIIQTKRNIKGRMYQINSEFLLYPEIRALFLKAQLLMEGDLVKKIKKLGGTVLIVLTGVFCGGEENVGTDLLIVGKINRTKLTRIIRAFEKKINFEINYTVMSRAEFNYRKDITDRFLYSILEGKKMVVLDKIR